MIIKCPHCDGKMKVDESRLSSGEQAKIRCPHCKEICSVRDPAQQSSRPESAGSASDKIKVAKSPSSEKRTDHDPTLPKDAFQNFRFPAETEAPPAPKKPARSALKTVIWVVVSLAVVAFFALLVNIVLPGPNGERLFFSPAITQQAYPEMPLEHENQAQSPVQSGAAR
jgi:predicted Zn finger-like uncharacterized protein